MAPISDADTFRLNTSIAFPAQGLATPILPRHAMAKRCFDIVAALAILVVAAPVMLLIALLVKLDGGPVLFRHRRVGAGGAAFGCLKFRTMVVDAERALNNLLARDAAARAEWEAEFKLRRDPRITWLGRFLRKSSLDELPQLFNVLAGQMSLVGPRPIVYQEIARYSTRIADYYMCRPGITGLWQVSGRNDVSYDERVALDSRYAREWSFTKDIVILLQTVRVVFQRSGAY
jgi:undecaprenyl-phosphate galactose phosphotransferase